MAEYIEREAANFAIQKKMQEYINKSVQSIGFAKYREDSFFTNAALGCRAAIEEVNSIPAADVRPVVLCRDCDCWNEWDSAGRESLGNYVCSCSHWSVEDGPILYTRPTDFCSYGEKREES